MSNGWTNLQTKIQLFSSGLKKEMLGMKLSSRDLSELHFWHVLRRWNCLLPQSHSLLLSSVTHASRNERLITVSQSEENARVRLISQPNLRNFTLPSWCLPSPRPHHYMTFPKSSVKSCDIPDFCLRSIYSLLDVDEFPFVTLGWFLPTSDCSFFFCRVSSRIFFIQIRTYFHWLWKSGRFF